MEWLLDFGADNPGKVNKQTRINQYRFQSMEISQQTGPGTLKHATSGPLNARACTSAPRFGPLVSSHSGPLSQIANLGALGAISLLLCEAE